MKLLLLCLLYACPLFAQELNILYQKNYEGPCSSHEENLIGHVKMSIEKANRLESKLTGHQFRDVEASIQWRMDTIPNYHLLRDIVDIPYYHLINNLCNFAGASHLHVGLLAGDSFIAALFGNQALLKQQIGVEWFKECPEFIFYSNCNQYLDINDYQIIKGNCFKIDKSLIEAPIDIYFYDADHSLIAHEKALTYYNDVLADVFIVVIDDWNCPWVRGPTFKAFKKLDYRILYQATISKIDLEHGQYIAVIRKAK